MMKNGHVSWIRHTLWCYRKSALVTAQAVHQDRHHNAPAGPPIDAPCPLWPEHCLLAARAAARSPRGPGVQFKAERNTEPGLYMIRRSSGTRIGCVTGRPVLLSDIFHPSAA